MDGTPPRERSSSVSNARQVSSSLKNRLQSARSMQRSNSSGSLQTAFQSRESTPLLFADFLLADSWPIGEEYKRESEKSENQRNYYFHPNSIRKVGESNISSLTTWGDVNHLLSTWSSFSAATSPIIFHCGNEQHLEEFKHLLLHRSGTIRPTSSLITQLQRLLARKYPQEAASILQPWTDCIPEIAQQFFENEVRIGRKKSVEDIKNTFGNWVYYPWNNNVVNILPARYFRELRISPDEAKLAKLGIGFIGIAEGKDIATAFAIEGIGSTFNLMEGCPSLPLSVANALQYQESNCVATAKALYDIDPYLNVGIFSFPEVESFFQTPSGAPLDIIFEQSQSVPLKIFIRQKAKEKKIPVVSIPSTFNVIDISLFQTQPDAPLFPGSTLPDSFYSKALNGEIRLEEFLSTMYKSCSSGEGFSHLSVVGVSVLAVAVIRKVMSGDFPRSACITVDINAYNMTPSVGILGSTPKLYDDFDIWTLGGRPRSYSVGSFFHGRPLVSDPQPSDPVVATGERTCIVRKSIFAFNARKEKELTITVGDEIAVITENKSGWWRGKNLRTEQIGWFPYNYTRSTDKKVVVNLDNIGSAPPTPTSGISPASSNENLALQLSQEEKLQKLKNAKNLSLKIMKLQAELAEQEKENKSRSRSNTDGPKQFGNFLEN